MLISHDKLASDGQTLTNLLLWY